MCVEPMRPIWPRHAVPFPLTVGPFADSMGWQRSLSRNAASTGRNHPCFDELS